MDGRQLRALVADEPLLADGGMGTALIERGVVSIDGCIEAANLTTPDDVAAVHQAAVDAGARMVETNTFGANAFNLAAHGLDGAVEEINAAGVALAQRSGALVAGSVGPLRVRLTPYGRVKRSEARRAYGDQIAALAGAGADLICIETQSDLVEMTEAFKAARQACDLAVVVLATFTRDDRTLLGSTPEQVASALAELGADGIGVNCSEGPAQVLRIVAAMAPYAEGSVLVALPNAGGPTRLGDRVVYPATPDYAGSHARAFVEAGAGIVGGCCGMGPAHIAAMRSALDEPRQLHLDVIPPRATDPGAEATTRPTDLKTKLDDGRFVVAVEVDPPRSVSTARVLAGAETLRDAGADVINVADSPMARMRMSPWAPARLIQETVGLETVLHFPTRGRNLLRIQGDLLTVHALGIRNLFVCMGDPVRIGDFPAATDNVDVVPTGLLSLIKQQLNEGQDQAGGSIGEPTAFVTGCAVNLNPADIEREIGLLARKIDRGADFALSQAVFDVGVLRTFRAAYEDRHGSLDLPILVGVQPLLTSRHAEFLANELPGSGIPDAIRRRMASTDDERREGLAVASELVGQIRGEAAGLYLMTPFDRFDIVAQIVDVAR